MNASVAVTKVAETQKDSSPTRSDNSSHRAQNEPEMQLDSLRGLINTIRLDGGTPSVERIATELSGIHAAQRAPALLALQRTHGNRYVQRVVAGIQAKLKVGQPGDKYEQEADRVAEQVMRMAEPQVQRQAEEEEEEELIQAKPLSMGITPLVQHQDEEEDSLQAMGVGTQPSKVFPDQEGISKLPGDSGKPLLESVRAFFEPRFGFDFSQIRLHTGTRATNAARELNAQAFTIGQDIYFDDSYYQPNTKQGQQLLAHELTHTIQQGCTSVSSSRGIQTHCTVSRPGDLLEREPDRVASRVVDGEASIGPITAGSARRVQRFDGIPSWEELVSGAEELYEEAVEAGGEALEWAEETAEEAVETVGEAAEWLATTSGQAAIEAANALAGLFGGSVIIRRGCIIITIPNIPLFPTLRETLGETPPVGFLVPFAGGGTLIGPFPVAGVVGALAYAQLSAEAAVGPGVLRNFRVEICPFAGRYMGTAQLYAAAAIGPRLTLFGGLFAAGGILIPVVPPIPIIAIIEGGLRGIGTGWLISAVQDTVTVHYSGGTLSFSNVTELMGGVLFQGDLQLFAALRLYNRIICQYAHPLEHWVTGRAMRLTIPIRASLSGNAGTGGVGPITWGPMPIEDIETAIRPLPTGWNCLGWAEIKRILCDMGVLLPEQCEEETLAGHPPTLGGPPHIPGVPPPGVGPPRPRGGGVAGAAKSNRIRVQLQHETDDVVPSVPVEKDSSVTVAEGKQAVDTLLSRPAKSVKKACKGAGVKMKKTIDGYPPQGVDSGGNVARKLCKNHPDYKRGIRLDLENMAGKNFTS